MKILLFGELTDITKSSSIEIETVNDVDELKNIVHQKFPSLQNHKYQIAVNSVLLTKNISLNETDEIALLPPFAGG
ncbi:MAG: MoaD/ThiS family protein [Bacteroidota bacterium]|jgi:sulfur-carrier protein